MKTLSRREFLTTTALAAAGTGTGACHTMSNHSRWPIYCFNRPWMQNFSHRQQPLSTPQVANWGFDVAARGVKEAGYDTIGLLTPMPDEMFIDADSTNEYLTRLKRRITAAGLKTNMGALHIKTSLSVEQAIADTRRQIDHAQFLKLEWLLTFGVDKPDHYELYYKVMMDAADYAQAANLKLVLKPHGGGSGASEEIKRCLARVNRPNFKIWYDAGNIIYYTGKDPIEELKPIAEYVTGVCAKDCSGKRGNVMIQFGTGEVDFAGVYKVLKAAGFKGPSYVECAGGKTYAEVTAGARDNRIFLEKIFASI